MAAALYLHNAIFTTEPSSPPLSAAHVHTHRSPGTGSRRNPHDRQLSSVSSFTLRTSTSEHSHPTEPLIHGSRESSVYLDLLAQQPTHPSSTLPRALGLTLDGDPVTPRERRIQYERMVRRRLRRLRWVQRVLWIVIGECGFRARTIRVVLLPLAHIMEHEASIDERRKFCSALRG